MMVALSLVLALVALTIFKFVSKPEKVARARDRAIARVLELWLFRTDPLSAFGALGRVVVADIRYLGTLLLPMAASLAPVLALLYAGSLKLANAPLAPGETAIVRVCWKGDTAPSLHLDAAAPLAVVAGPVPCGELHETAWKVARSQENMTAKNGAPFFAVEPRADSNGRPFRVSADLPIANYDPFGRLPIDWLVATLVLSLLFGLALKKPFKVEF